MAAAKVDDVLSSKEPYGRLHGQSVDASTKAWELVESVVDGLIDGTYTLKQVKRTCQERLQELKGGPFSLKDIGFPSIVHRKE